MCVCVCLDVCECVVADAYLRICSGLIVQLTHALWWCSEITIKMTHVPSLSWHHIQVLFSLPVAWLEHVHTDTHILSLPVSLVENCCPWWTDWEAVSYIFDSSSLPFLYPLAIECLPTWRPVIFTTEGHVLSHFTLFNGEILQHNVAMDCNLKKKKKKPCDVFFWYKAIRKRKWFEDEANFNL